MKKPELKHPWCVIENDEPLGLEIICNKAEDRDKIIKAFKRTIIFRNIRKVDLEPCKCFMPCKNLKQRQFLHTTMLFSMKQTAKMM